MVLCKPIDSQTPQFGDRGCWWLGLLFVYPHCWVHCWQCPWQIGCILGHINPKSELTLKLYCLISPIYTYRSAIISITSCRCITTFCNKCYIFVSFYMWYLYQSICIRDIISYNLIYIYIYINISKPRRQSDWVKKLCLQCISFSLGLLLQLLLEGSKLCSHLFHFSSVHSSW